MRVPGTRLWLWQAIVIAEQGVQFHVKSFWSLLMG